VKSRPIKSIAGVIESVTEGFKKYCEWTSPCKSSWGGWRTCSINLRRNLKLD